MSTAVSDSTAVVTVSYNSSAQLEAFLSSIERGDRPAFVLIADNASGDVEASREIAHAHGAELIALPKNLGYGGAVNEAVRRLPESIEYVLISNPDVSLGPDALRILTDALETSPGTGAVGPTVLNEDGSVYRSARAFPSLRNGVGHALFTTFWPRNPWSRAYHNDQGGQRTRRSVGWLSGSCLLVRRSAFDGIGGFDEEYFMYFEDVDLGYRLQKAGWDRVYLPEASVVHAGALSTSREPARMIRAHHSSAYRYLEKKYGGTALAPLRWALKAGLMARAWYLTRGWRR